MEKSVYLGLTTKTAKRIGIPRHELESQKPIEAEKIVSTFKSFMQGNGGRYVVKASQIVGRLDVKHCLGEVGRRRSLWKSRGLTIEVLDTQLTEATGREVTVEDAGEYVLLKVTYDG